MDPRLDNFLKLCKVTKGEAYTHTSMLGGLYYIPVELMDDFRILYKQVISSGGIATITEKTLDVCPLIVDIDYKVPMDQGHGRLYTPETVRSLIKIYRDIIDEITVDPKPHHKYCVVLEKTAPRVDKGALKDGFHLHFPYFYAEQWVQKDGIRIKAIDAAKKRKIFDAIPIAGSLEKVFDDNVPANPWLMYGSCKTANSECWKVSKYYDENDEKISFKHFWKYHPLAQTSKPLEADLVDYLSIITESDKTPLKYGAIMRPKTKPRNGSSLSKEKRGDTSGKSYDTILADLIIAEQLMEFVSTERARDYATRMEIGWILYNVGEGDGKALEMWKDFCRNRGPDFDEDSVNERWSKMEVKNCTMGSLRFIAQKDDPEGYKRYKNEQVNNVVQGGLSQTHNDVAKILFKMYEGKFICADPERDIWYEFRGHRWIRVASGITLRMTLSHELVGEYQRIQKEFLILAERSNDPEQKQNLNAKVGIISQLISKLKNNGFKTAVMKEAKEYFYDQKFTDRMDESKDLTVFENGVYDAANKIFREGRPDDYCTKSTHRNFHEFEDDDPKVLEYHRLLETIFVNPSLRKFFIQSTCSLIRGGNRHKLFLFWTGISNNGKSVLADLLEKGFGEYHYTPPTSLITSKRSGSSGATAELVPLKGARVVVMSETSRDDTLNEGVIKMLSSGGDPIYARGLFRDPIKIIPQHVPILHCNKLPGLASDDVGSWNRAHVLTFPSVFVNPSEAPKSKEEQIRQLKFPMDKSLKDRLDSYADVFMWHMIKMYEKYCDVELEVPAEVLNATRAYRKSNDYYMQFVEEKLIKTDAKSDLLTLTLVYEMFKDFYTDAFPNKKNEIPNKNDVLEAMEKVMGKAAPGKLWFGWRKPEKMAVGGLHDDTE
jgi:P4 family phage/plasmid primase-like protien